MSFQCGIGIFRFLPSWHPAPWVFRYEFTEGVPSANGAGLAVAENARQPSAICAIGYSVCFSACHVCIVALPPSVPLYRKNIPEQEAARLQTKGKRLGLQKSSIMAIELIDRKESASYKGSIYELTLLWDRESIRKCFCGMPPFFAYIRKDGANFASIDCYSNDNGRFVVKKFMPSLLARPDWQVRFDKDINTIPLLELLAGLPI